MKKIANIIYLFSLGLYLIASFWSQTFLPALFEGKTFVLVLILCLLLLLIKELIYVDFGIKTALTAFGMFVLGIIAIYIFPAHKTLMVTMFFIFAARNLDYKKVISLSLYVSVIFFIFVVVCGATGVIYNVISLDLIADRERYYLGFRYVLIPASMWGNIVCMWMIKRINYFTLKEIFLVALINQILFEFLNSRLIYCLVIAQLGALLILKSRLNMIMYSFFIKKMLLWTMFIACVFSFYVTVNYNSTDTFQYLINFALEDRLALGQDALRIYGWPMFGAPIEWIGAGLDDSGFKANATYNYVDCAYIRLMLDYGIVTLIIFLYSTFIFLRKMEKRNNIVLLIVFWGIAVHGIIDDAILVIPFNTCLLLLGSLISTKKECRI